MAIGIVALGLPFACNADNGCVGQPSGYFSKPQAMTGKKLYLDNCAECHSADLKGNSGPALYGHDFESYLKFSHISAPQLLAFMQSQMPYQAPGSLKPDEYQDIFSYILDANGYKSGSADLNQSNVSCIPMLPYPGKDD
ncbi:MAG: c-type cytochrome [Betaproteobacteria bacterium]|nr:c-type cytochrome [Betaproteobacteria bacterium]